MGVCCVSLLSFVLFFLVVVDAQTCVPLNATFSATPAICKPSYYIPSQYNNNTGGDALYTFFNSLTTLASHACAESFAAYYCNVYYPQCSNNTVNATCADTCYAVLTDCDNDKALFTSASVPYPTVAQCNALGKDESTCSVPPQTDLSAFYTDCAIPNRDLFNLPPTEIVCSSNHSVVITNNSYDSGRRVWFTFQNFDMSLADIGSHVNDTMEGCFQAFANFYCALAFPTCPSNQDPKKQQQLCADVCYTVISECDFLKETFGIRVENFHIPNVTYCRSFPTTNCITPSNNDTDLGYFFSGGLPPTIAPESSTTIKYPPGGAARGGGLGAGVLVGLLLIIGLLMLIMKKQDSH